MMILSDPSMWLGLLTLVLLEIVLGIDNLVFIAILVKKLPAQLQDKARLIGLSLALILRLALLGVMSWLVTLTTPLLHLGEWEPSGRDLILIAGGLFLLFKATVELHDRLEGKSHSENSNTASHSSFSSVIIQILLVDAVFSIDSIITAVGMVDHVAIMMVAVVIAMIVMLAASKPLTHLVNSHPTIVILCLGFLLMIGFSLLAEGFGLHIPKAYLYVAIGFSILIELFNQIVRRNTTVVTEPEGSATQLTIQGTLLPADQSLITSLAEKAAMPVKQIMIGRARLVWLNTNDNPAFLLKKIEQANHSYYPVCSGDIDRVLGIAKHTDLIAYLSNGDSIAELARKQQPLIVKKHQSLIHVLSLLNAAHHPVALISDEFGNMQGLVNRQDLLDMLWPQQGSGDEKIIH